MFKQILIILIIIIILIVLIKRLTYKLILSESTVKYTLNGTDRKFITCNSIPYNTSENTFENNTHGIVLTVINNYSTNNNNYIYDKVNSMYYILDKDYYYYIPNLDNFEMVLNKVKIMNIEKFLHKIIFVK